jgi:PadR family transcriptional regulator, regulatory protein PadR
MSFEALPGWQALPRLDAYLYLDRLEAVVRDRAFSAQALSVLAVLCARPQMWRHGYDIARETGLKAGTLYPILIRLADRGWLEASWEDGQPAGRPRRHLYRLTRYHPHVGHCATSGDDGQVHPVLASEHEREQTLQTVSHAVGEGRLNLDEAELRIEAVLHSRHRHELAGLVGDLPPQPALSEPGKCWGSSPVRLGLLALAAVTILAAAVVQAVAGLWELWPAAVVGCGLWAARPRR